MIRIITISLVSIFVLGNSIITAQEMSFPWINEVYKDYKYLHQNPELSFLEKETSSFLAEKIASYGYEVESEFGGYGVVAILKNGPGKTVLVRADTDALPVLESTGAKYASVIKMKDITEETVPVMHACGHDIHMSVWLGTARFLAENKDKWKGTIIFIAQPAEERSGGAKAMLKDGLFDKYPIPDHALALHVSSSMPAGKIGWKSEYALANVDMVDITVKGIGGHGAYPHTTKDPVTIAAKLILDLQTIVSREISPTEAAVVTVGSIHGGTKGNVIPDEVNLKLTLRSYTDEVRQKIIEAIDRKCKAAIISAGLDSSYYPTINYREEYTPALYNNIDLVKEVVPYFYDALGENNVLRVPAVMGGEDFGRYGRTKEHVPIFMYWLGAVKPEVYEQAVKNGETLPSLHNSGFLPDYEPTITTGIKSMSAAVIGLLH